MVGDNDEIEEVSNDNIDSNAQNKNNNIALVNIDQNKIRNDEPNPFKANNGDNANDKKEENQSINNNRKITENNDDKIASIDLVDLDDLDSLLK